MMTGAKTNAAWSHTWSSRKFSVATSEGVIPDPIPNSEVKPSRADGTARVTAWESRSPPGLLAAPQIVRSAGFFYALRRRERAAAVAAFLAAVRVSGCGSRFGLYAAFGATQCAGTARHARAARGGGLERTYELVPLLLS